MDDIQNAALAIFRKTGALLEGHFILRSGLHSGHFFQCARVCEQMPEVEQLTAMLLPKLGALEFSTVLAPAMGGLVIGQEIARQTRSRYLFAEKQDDQLVMRRGFTLAPGERVLIAEDVVTRGGRVRECVEIVKAAGAVPVGITMLVDRSGGRVGFGIPTVSLLALSFPTYAPDQVPPEIAALPPQKPGS